MSANVHWPPADRDVSRHHDLLPLAHPELDANYWAFPAAQRETAVMDDEGNLFGEGQPGEIVHRGANAMLGYPEGSG